MFSFIKNLFSSSRKEKRPELSDITIVKCLGVGHFSHVYEGEMSDGTKVAIKVIERGSEKNIQKEINILRILNGTPHIVNLIDTFDDEDNTIIIFNLIKGIDKQTFLRNVTLSQLRILLHQLLEALAAAHAKNIVHRDITLNNIIVTDDYTNIWLIDWGCGAIVKQRMAINPGTRNYRAPEMLLGCETYGSKADMWSFGVFAFSILSMEGIPWGSKSADNILRRMSTVFEAKEIHKLSKKLGIELSEDIQLHSHANIDIEEFIHAKQKRLNDPQLLDLIRHCLQINPDKRLSAEEAMNHTFFQQNIIPS